MICFSEIYCEIQSIYNDCKKYKIVVEKILGSFKSRECEFANKRDRDDK